MSSANGPRAGGRASKSPIGTDIALGLVSKRYSEAAYSKRPSTAFGTGGSEVDVDGRKQRPHTARGAKTTSGSERLALLASPRNPVPHHNPHKRTVSVGGLAYAEEREKERLHAEKRSPSRSPSRNDPFSRYHEDRGVRQQVLRSERAARSPLAAWREKEKERERRKQNELELFQKQGILLSVRVRVRVRVRLIFIFIRLSKFPFKHFLMHHAGTVDGEEYMTEQEKEKKHIRDFNLEPESLSTRYDGLGLRAVAAKTADVNLNMDHDTIVKGLAWEGDFELELEEGVLHDTLGDGRGQGGRGFYSGRLGSPADRAARNYETGKCDDEDEGLHQQFKELNEDRIHSSTHNANSTIARSQEWQDRVRAGLERAQAVASRSDEWIITEEDRKKEKERMLEQEKKILLEEEREKEIQREHEWQRRVDKKVSEVKEVLDRSQSPGRNGRYSVDSDKTEKGEDEDDAEMQSPPRVNRKDDLNNILDKIDDGGVVDGSMSPKQYITRMEDEYEAFCKRRAEYKAEMQRNKELGEGTICLGSLLFLVMRQTHKRLFAFCV